MKHLSAFITKMKASGIPRQVIDTFADYYGKVVSGETGLLCNRDIRPVLPDEVADFDHLKGYAPAGEKALPKTVMIVLNGGLGTSMGLTGAKSLLQVKNGRSFLEIILQQAHSSGVNLALMNSFNTHDDTMAALDHIRPIHKPLTFIQHKFPKILKDTLAPALWPADPALEWNPPGHGNIYTAMYTSGILRKLMSRGIRYAFICNSDNLGAGINEALLGYFSENRIDFMMEVAERTPLDAKGGHLARHVNGRLILRESAQCPEDEKTAFQDISRFCFFNTNNIWINLATINSLLGNHKASQLPMILNTKTLDPRDENSPAVYQVETAMGAAIHLIDNAVAVRVPRKRFFPVKKCNELLAIRSDCFVFSKNSRLIQNPRRRYDTITINLDPAYYGKFDMLENRFPRGVPSLLDCESLTIRGDVLFEKNVTVRGNVTIQNSSANQAVISAGTVIDKDLIF
ncbi:MAG: UTP--glucose-1-phosphate uridylyltransferase [Deltaproteobacteria bacterium]|nr:MAG: UTP--glucose-1-phosphate uridylyltransferase [Deltaproteobacteria bacterium]